MYGFQILFLLSLAGCNCYRLDLETANPAIDHNLHEEVIDDEECQRQLEYIRSDILLTLQCKYPLGLVST